MGKGYEILGMCERAGLDKMEYIDTRDESGMKVLKIRSS